MSESKNDTKQHITTDGARHVLEAQKSSQASANRKGLQPEIANRVRRVKDSVKRSNSSPAETSRMTTLLTNVKVVDVTGILPRLYSTCV
ncbi:unnamed protein product [Clavelina lepadiformis]|uniref:Uncharacterized protein n=1 Tax=Clavelina lepadiformis TaxID=159417 RepID=A0ABP0F7A1_CLALP